VDHRHRGSGVRVIFFPFFNFLHPFTEIVTDGEVSDSNLLSPDLTLNTIKSSIKDAPEFLDFSTMIGKNTDLETNGFYFLVGESLQKMHRYSTTQKNFSPNKGIKRSSGTIQVFILI
jgi:hypothetical protein